MKLPYGDSIKQNQILEEVGMMEKKDKDEPTLKDIMKSLCKITKSLESIKNQLGKLENISKR